MRGNGGVRSGNIEIQAPIKRSGPVALTALQLVALLCSGSVPHGVEDTTRRRRDGGG